MEEEFCEFQKIIGKKLIRTLQTNNEVSNNNSYVGVIAEQEVGQ
jgi:hypothetical protein